MRKINSTFKTGFLSEEGNKLQNRDYFAYVELDKLACYVLADGLDEDNDKQSAEMAVASIISNFTEKPSFSKSAIKRYVRAANDELKKTNQGHRLKASIVVVITNYVKARYCVVGNSRFYLLRNNKLLFRSNDQSLTNNLVEEDKLGKDKAALHEERNNLYQYLGQKELLNPRVSRKMRLDDGDIWLLLTRGIWEYCDDGELVDASSEVKEPEEVVNNVEDLILSKQPHKLDNYTLTVTFIDKIYHNPKKKWTAKKIFLTLLPIAIILIGISIVLFIRNANQKNNTDQMNGYIKSAEKYVELNNYLRAAEDYDEALKLSKKLKKDKIIKELDKEKKLVEQIIFADQALEDGNYKEALTLYMEALKMSYDCGNMSKEYIEEQYKKTLHYEEVYTLLEQGDALMELGDYEGARVYYIEAKTLASNIFFQEGKQEAVEKIMQIDTLKAQQKKDDKAAQEKEEEKAEKEQEKAEKEQEKAEAKAAEEEEKAKQEAEKNAEEKAKAEEAAKAQKAAKEAAEKAEEEAARRQEQEDLLGALEMEEKGNKLFEDKDYGTAQMYYLIAQELYTRIDMIEAAETVEKKIKLAQSKDTEKRTKLQKADDYVVHADEFVQEEKYYEAEFLYQLAIEIYNELNRQDRIEKVEKKLDILYELY